MNDTIIHKTRLADFLFERGDNDQKQAVDIIKKGIEKNKLDVTKVVDFLNSDLGRNPKVREILAAGTDDREAGDEVISVENDVYAPVSKLKPTQIEIDITKSVVWPGGKIGVLDNIMSGKASPGGSIVSSDRMIIDGHHRWSQVFAFNPRATIKSTNLNLPGSVRQKLGITQIAIANKMGDSPLPSAGTSGRGNSIFGKSAEELYGLLKGLVGKSPEPRAGPFMSDEVVNHITSKYAKQFRVDSEDDSEAARDKILKQLATNLSKLPQPVSNLPPRKDMPQLDQVPGGPDAVFDQLASGDVNFKPSYSTVDKKKKPVKKESSSRAYENYVLEKWAKIAGIRD